MSHDGCFGWEYQRKVLFAAKGALSHWGTNIFNPITQTDKQIITHFIFHIYLLPFRYPVDWIWGGGRGTQRGTQHDFNLIIFLHWSPCRLCSFHVLCSWELIKICFILIPCRFWCVCSIHQKWRSRRKILWELFPFKRVSLPRQNKVINSSSSKVK